MGPRQLVAKSRRILRLESNGRFGFDLYAFTDEGAMTLLLTTFEKPWPPALVQHALAEPDRQLVKRNDQQENREQDRRDMAVVVHVVATL